MLQLLMRKWWVILLQGILLVILGFFVYNNPVGVVAGISFWFGLIVLATGVIGMISWLFADKAERETLSILWSILTAILGFLMITNLLATMATVSVIFGLWILVTGIHLTRSGWALKGEHSAGWIMLIAGLLVAIAGVMMIFNIGTAAIGISTLLCLELILAGIALIVLSFAKRTVSSKVKDKIETLKAKL